MHPGPPLLLWYGRLSHGCCVNTAGQHAVESQALLFVVMSRSTECSILCSPHVMGVAGDLPGCQAARCQAGFALEGARLVLPCMQVTLAENRSSTGAWISSNSLNRQRFSAQQPQRDKPCDVEDVNIADHQHHPSTVKVCRFRNTDASYRVVHILSVHSRTGVTGDPA